MTTAGSTAIPATRAIGAGLVPGLAVLAPAGNTPAAPAGNTLAGLGITVAAPAGITPAARITPAVRAGTTGTESVQLHPMTLVLQSEH
jgi:hypothetical protein